MNDAPKSDSNDKHRIAGLDDNPDISVQLQQIHTTPTGEIDVPDAVHSFVCDAIKKVLEGDYPSLKKVAKKLQTLIKHELQSNHVKVTDNIESVTRRIEEGRRAVVTSSIRAYSRKVVLQVLDAVAESK